MPSIPQSLLWISLVVLWLFVLVPMLISKRDAVRRTSDVALATRVLNGGGSERLLRRRAPAAGHASDPDWRPSEDDLNDDMDDDLDEEVDDEPPGRSVVRAAVVDVEQDTESDYLDVDVIGEDSGALPVGESESEEREAENDELTLEFDEPVAHDPVADEPVAEDAPLEQELDGSDDEYEYVADSSGLEAPSETELQIAESVSAARRRRHESKTATAVSVRKYKFRRRMLTFMAAVLLASAATAFTLSSALWWVCGAVGVVTVLYLGYLRRQTRIEERLRRRRAQRVARSRLGVENTHDREFDVVPSRLRRPGSVVLEIDDEDPIFEHLDYAPFARGFDLPRAAGQ
jgi:uncharacterized membrane protein